MAYQIYDLFRNAAFLLDAEHAHELTLNFLHHGPKLAKKILVPSKYEFLNNSIQDGKFSVKTAMGTWKTPIGLAAGLDKNGLCLPFFSQLPFGAIEIGTVTPKPQDGNPRPRLFRLKEEQSLLNRMGFNNLGKDKMAQAVAKDINIVHLNKGVLGINIGKNKVTEEKDAPRDYVECYETLAPYADYVVVNVSSPNTPNLRNFEQASGLQSIFEALQGTRKNCGRPLFVKISPDGSDEMIPAILELSMKYELSGIIATNTTIMPERGQGGVSGKLLKERSRRKRNLLLKTKNEMGAKNLEIISVGGIDTLEELWEVWCGGGQLVQIYSSFIYQGPGLLFSILGEINRQLDLLKFKSVQELLDQRSSIPKVPVKS